MHGHVLERDDQAVPPEDCHEPRHTGGGHPDIRGEILVVEPQRSHVADRLRPSRRNVAVRTRAARRHSAPSRLHLIERLPDRAGHAAAGIGGFVQLPVVLRHQQSAGVPDRAGGKVEIEDDPPIGEARRRVGVNQPVDETTHKVFPRVRVDEIAVRLRTLPCALDARPHRDVSLLDLEEVGEVGTDIEFEYEMDRRGVVIDDVVVFVNRLAHRARERQADTMAGYILPAVPGVGAACRRHGRRCSSSRARWSAVPRDDR